MIVFRLLVAASVLILGTAGAAAAGKFGGTRVGEKRWVFQRQALLDYYQELRDEPERLVKVFSSMEPLYNESNRITGYKLEIDGEAEFFNGVGRAEGDVVRSVNKLDMTSRSRAEYFLGEFVGERANTFDIVIERDGEEQILNYMVR